MAPPKYAHGRVYWEFGGGMYTDLFVHQLTHLTAMGVRFRDGSCGQGALPRPTAATS